jgi:Mn-dependent DtxR family transcriptional regulator
MTPDEKLMLKLYELAMKEGDPHTPVEAMQAARAIGVKETALKNIIKHLAQANLVKKIDDTTVYLTTRGCDFALEMQGL